MSGKPILWATVALVAVTSSASADASPPACPYERAHYVLQGDPDVVAHFVKHGKVAQTILGDLFLRITVTSRHWDFWYFPDTGNGYSTISLISMEDPDQPAWRAPDPDSRQGRPEADETYYELNADLTFRTDFPESSVRAPVLFLIPELGQHIWYDNRTMASGNRYAMARAFFRLDHCE
jgi:hypothetical protein